MRLTSLVLVLFLATLTTAAPPAQGFHKRVSVSAPTRLDWTFVLGNRSLLKAPDNWQMGDYDSTKQTYDLYVPARKDAKQPMPLILYITPAAKDATPINVFKGSCDEIGALFVAVNEVHNEVPMRQRIRIILDALDDVRRQFPVDPDRTYIVGLSGGGRVAGAIAFALPEYFGGYMPLCASADLRDESWLRQRVVDRLSVALITGEKDFNRGEVERWRGPYLAALGVRTKVWVQPGMSHTMPSEVTIHEALRWLEADLPRRQDLARKRPASHGGDNGRDAQAADLLAEGKERLKKPETLYSGLMQLKGVMVRWPDLAVGKAAEKILEEYDARKEKPWEADDIAEQRRFLAARARSLDAYASGDLPPVYAGRRNEMLKQAIDLWEQVRNDTPDSEAGKQAAQRIPALEKMMK